MLRLPDFAYSCPARVNAALAVAGLALAASAPLQAQTVDKPVYRCPGPPVLYTDSISSSEARERNCHTIEGATVTVVPATKPRTAPASAARPANAGNTASSPADSRIDPAAQRARDSDARRILSDELQREEERLAEIKRQYNNGQPERQGDERNYQKYLDRVADLKASIMRKEADVAAIKRELAKLPS